MHGNVIASERQQNVSFRSGSTETFFLIRFQICTDFYEKQTCCCVDSCAKALFLQQKYQIDQSKSGRGL